MERRSFLKGLLGTTAAIAIPTGVVKANEIVNPSTEWMDWILQVQQAVKFKQVSIINESLTTKVLREYTCIDSRKLSTKENHSIRIYKRMNLWDKWFWISISQMNYFILVDDMKNANNMYYTIKSTMKLQEINPDEDYPAYRNSLRSEYENTVKHLDRYYYNKDLGGFPNKETKEYLYI